jgi:hypothetical protein
LAAVTDTVGKFLPAFPVIFTHTVLDRVDGELVDELFQIVNLFIGCTFLAFCTFEFGIIVDTIFIEFGGSTVHGDHDVFARFISGCFNGSDNAVQSVFRTFQIWSETTFITYGST